jgi:hypothetical protein
MKTNAYERLRVESHNFLRERKTKTLKEFFALSSYEKKTSFIIH